MRAASETARPFAEKHSVVIREAFGDPLPELMLDEVKMRQVVTNLLVNAIKFSPRNGEVLLRATREPKWVRIDVCDQGPGIGADEATHIFELFGQGGHPNGRSDMGVGIGLHLVKRISELHGGHVGVNSTPGEGSTFWVRLPIAPARDVGMEEVAKAA
jgi:two-component system sensor histidine kinase SaeS